MRPLLLYRMSHRSSCGVKQWVGVRRLVSQFAAIRNHLQQHQAGSVELEKNSDTGIAILTLNNPGRKNAVSGSMMVELADHVTELSQWEEGRGVVLRGADNTFCSGGDLKTVMGLGTREEAGDMSALMQDTMTRLRSLPLVSLALVQGTAIGGGAELAVACDVRAMTEDARLGFVQVRMGLTTGWGGGTHLVQLLGRPRALRLLGSSKILTLREALEVGLVEHTLPADSAPLSAALTLLLDTYCRGATPLVQGMKEVVVGVEDDGGTAQALERERKVFTALWRGEANLAALSKNLKHS
ncbi:ethylmalonyl-CoA decarboxylase-like [Babylonia areolata]|uniref:ethylmalonyl-CoA decarboxylase-like n=1 Tax=Babylonia areolata TaxID=304850 RepID=UPI003FD619B4